MPMRHDCRYHGAQEVGPGDTLRTCELDLAPAAPWRCPADCPAYVPDPARSGSSALGTADEPPGLDERADAIVALLDEAEAIVGSAAEVARSEAEQEWLRRQRQEAGGDERRAGRIRRRFRRDR